MCAGSASQRSPRSVRVMGVTEGSEQERLRSATRASRRRSRSERTEEEAQGLARPPRNPDPRRRCTPNGYSPRQRGQAPFLDQRPGHRQSHARWPATAQDALIVGPSPPSSLVWRTRQRRGRRAVRRRSRHCIRANITEPEACPSLALETARPQAMNEKNRTRPSWRPCRWAWPWWTPRGDHRVQHCDHQVGGRGRPRMVADYVAYQAWWRTPAAGPIGGVGVGRGRQ